MCVCACVVVEVVVVIVVVDLCIDLVEWESNVSVKDVKRGFTYTDDLFIVMKVWVEDTFWITW